MKYKLFIKVKNRNDADNLWDELAQNICKLKLNDCSLTLKDCSLEEINNIIELLEEYWELFNLEYIKIKTINEGE